MPKFTLIEALQHIGKVFNDKQIAMIHYDGDSGLRFVIQHNENGYQISLNELGKVNSIVQIN